MTPEFVVALIIAGIVGLIVCLPVLRAKKPRKDEKPAEPARAPIPGGGGPGEERPPKP